MADIRRELAPSVEQGRWVIDGNYQMLSDLLWPRATTVVWLDYSMGRCLWRTLKRTVGRAWRRELLWGTNRESLAMSFMSRDSILLWVVRMHGPRRRALAEAAGRPESAHLAVLRFRRPRQAETFIASVGR